MLSIWETDSTKVDTLLTAGILAFRPHWLSFKPPFLPCVTLTFCDLFPCYFWSEWEDIIALKGCFVHHFDDEKGWYPHPLTCHKTIAFNLWSLWIQSLISVSSVHVQITQQCLNPSSVHPATRVFSFTTGMKTPQSQVLLPCIVI